MSVPAATLKRCDDQEKWVAAEDFVNGQITQAPSGRAAIIEGLDPNGAKTGDTVGGRIRGQFSIAKDGNAYSVGDVAAIDESAQQVVPDGNSLADYRGGLVVKAAAAGDSTVEVALNAEAAFGNTVRAETVTFEEDGDTTYTGSVELPAGALLLDIIVHAVALWDDGTGAVMKVGDGTDDNGFFTGIDLKATDLLAGESISFGYTGGKEGADLDGGETAGDHVRRRYLATARTISGVVTTTDQDGSAGRTRMTVVYVVPDTVEAATGA